MRIELRDDSVLIDGYVNAVERDSRPLLDEKGERFVERIMPTTFRRAIERSDNIYCLLNHEDSRVLGSTKDGNVELYEDNVGLRAICNITDSEVIEKARDNKLRGWSFGFELLKSSEEPVSEGLKRRFVEDMRLLEVSIIDDRKLPAYIGTSIETRAQKECKIEYRASGFEPKVIDLRSKEKSAETQQTPSDNYYRTLEKNINLLNFGGR